MKQISQRKCFLNQIPVSRTIHEDSQKIVSKCNGYIQFPSTLLQLRRPQQIWSTTFTHPYVIGVIDGTLIPVQKPPAAFHLDENIFALGFLIRKHSRWSGVCKFTC